MSAPQLIVLDVKSGAAMESQSGLQMKWPRIYGAFQRASNKRIAALVLHPSSNFLGHYLLPPLPKAGISLLALNTRYVGNDSCLLMERVIQDLGAGVKFLRQQGFDRIVLLGNSGGAATMALYQAEAENLTITDTPAGDLIDLSCSDLPAADGIVLFGAHPGRAKLMTTWLDASVICENDSMSVDPEFNIYDSANGPPFTNAFVTKVRDQQRKRNRCLTEWVRARLDFLKTLPDGPDDEAFVVHRTFADPRFMDLTLDPNDRVRDSLWGDPKAVNYSANNIGRFTTLKSWLSQWSSESRADGPECLARTTVPVLNVEFSADAAVFPSDIRIWSKAAAPRETYAKITGARHYLDGQPEHLATLVCLIQEWAQSL